VLAAASFLEKNITSRPLLTGYSFGAWVNSMVVARSNEWKAILIAPPLAIYDFDVKALAGKIELIIAAQYDQFCSGEKVREMSKQLGCTLEIIPGADHFFSRQEDLLSQVLADFFIGTKRCHS
jgi:alpha/beta superfamily hydrolase